ncbi:bifunctional YncE family protein/alkaline phosphatase family protein [Acidicapsa acidisoli]|uniref:bifunctional YncE family protein/alkaline phosphatase family protein n=1 Tax=Acidicapsa acidisoli TaxID=1615681 RepID=UPI0021E0DFF2|nr:bifunctional YncE family protein/alkaline phosphatase family protein [Acidicapsa acidisoli]
MFRENSGIKPMLIGLLAAGLSVSAFAQSVPFPTYTVGPQSNGTYVVSNGTIITPAGTQVDLGIRVRAKAVAVNPKGNHTAAVLTMGTSPSNGNGAVEVFNTQTGKVLQSYSFNGKDSTGSNLGIHYTPDGKYLVFSQDSSHVTIASVNATTGLLSDHAQVSVPMDVDSNGNLTTVQCFPNSPPGTTGSSEIPCGQTVSLVSDGTSTSYPTGIAISSDSKTAYVVLDNNNTLTKIDLTQATPVEGTEIRVGNVPHSVVISQDGKTAYVSNEAGRIATEKDFQGYSNGTPVVAQYPTGSTATGTLSVVDLNSFKVTGSINTGLHPTGMAFWGSNRLLVANAYSDTLSVIDTTTNTVERTINLGLPIGVPGQRNPAYGAGPNSIAVDGPNWIAYVALYNANAIAVVNLTYGASNPVMGLIPVGYAPSSVVLDSVDNALLVANDKGIGTTGISPQNSSATEFGVTGLNTHQDLGTVSIVPVPKIDALLGMTQQVYQNNHWDLADNIFSAAGGNRHAKPLAIPEKIGDPSKIKHVFLIIRENRTYDQILGDVTHGNGDASLAVFGDNGTYGSITPNAHALVQRFPLFDNYYNPSRQSADGHNWIVQAMAPYSDDIQSPDWLRDYPSNGGDAIAYQAKGHLWDQAAKAGISFKNFGEYIEYNTFLTPTGSTTEPQWIDFYNDTLAYESGKEKQLYNYNTVASHSPLPNLINNTVQNYPQFDLGIPDQFRVDVWEQDFAKDVTAGTVPQLEILWISSDHTGGPPTAQAMQADNDLALGRFVDIISHSSIWSSSAIFVTEDDAQTGVDHVDGHRSPGYIFSPYTLQGGVTDSTFYTQVNMTRTIEQILGLQPMNQFDLWASPMRTAFVDDPPADNFKPWTHVPAGLALTTGVSQTPTQPIPGTIAAVTPRTNAIESPAVKALRAGWMKKKSETFAGKYSKPDSEDPDTVNHMIWYEATNYTRPFPGEKKVRPASDFNNAAPAKDDDDDDK